MEMADEYLVDIINKNINNQDNSSVLSDNFYQKLGNSYLKNITSNIPLSSSTNSNKIMKLNEFIEKVINKWFELTLCYSDKINEKTQKPMNWKDEISLISCSNNALSRTITGQQRFSRNSNNDIKKNKLSSINIDKNEIDFDKKYERKEHSKEIQNRLSTPSEKKRNLIFRKNLSSLSRQKNNNSSNDFHNKNSDYQLNFTDEKIIDLNQKSNKLETNQPIIHFRQNVTFQQNTTKVSNPTKRNLTSEMEWNSKSFHSLPLNRDHQDLKKLQNIQNKCNSEQIENSSVYKIINTRKLRVLHENSKREHEKKLESLGNGSYMSKLTINSEPLNNTKEILIKSPISCNKKISKRPIFDFKRAETLLRSSKHSEKMKIDYINESNSSFYFYDLGLVGPNWIEYIGEIKNGKKNGFGKWILGNNERFEGNFQDGKAYGKGRYITKDGEVLTGFWINNVFQKDFKHEIILPQNENNSSENDTRQYTI
jgi:hypothetical protein